MGDTFRVELTSVDDREALVAQVWLGENLLEELRHEGGRVRVELYSQPTGRPSTRDTGCRLRPILRRMHLG